MIARRTPSRPTTTTGRATRRSAIAHEQAIIYELHVGGFTRHPSSGVGRPGSFAALIEKIPYLQSLGVTHVELTARSMAFDEQDVPAGHAALGLRNYWGYSPWRVLRAARGLRRRRRRRRGASCATSSRRCTAQASGSSSTSCSTTPPKAARTGRPCTSRRSRTAPSITSMRAASTSTSAAAATRSTATIRRRAGCCSNAPSTGCARCTWTASASTWRACSPAARTAAARADAWLPGALAHSPVLAHTWLIAEPWDAGGLYQVGAFPGAALRRVERTLSRRRAALRARRFRAARRAGATRSRASRDLYAGERPHARAQHQLHHLSRRLHAVGPRELRAQAQRGERRGQPRRQRRQLELELRRRRRDLEIRPSCGCARARRATSWRCCS